MRFRFIEEHGCEFPTNRLCQVLDVSERGLRAFRSRPASQRQRTDMVVLAHIKEQSRLSLGSYGRPRMTEELKELGLNVGHRRVGRLMRENGIRVERSKKYKVTTDSNSHAFQHCANLLNRDFQADQAEPEMGGRHQLCLDARGLVVSGRDLGLAFPTRDRLGGEQPDEARPRDPGLEDGRALRQPPKGCIHHTDRGQPILFARLSKAPAPAWVQGIDERQRQLL